VIAEAAALDDPGQVPDLGLSESGHRFLLMVDGQWLMVDERTANS
jgi:hypothetical protein